MNADLLAQNALSQLGSSSFAVAYYYSSGPLDCRQGVTHRTKRTTHMNNVKLKHRTQNLTSGFKYSSVAFTYS